MSISAVDPGATMLADLDLLLTAVFCTADDLLPEKAKNARRSVTDAEVVTLAVAQAIMGVSSDDRFLRLAKRALKELFPKLPQQPGFHKRRAKLDRDDRVVDRHFRRAIAGLSRRPRVDRLDAGGVRPLG